MTLPIPVSLKSEHDALRAAVRRGMRERGGTGEAARRVAEVLEGHMMREEKFVFRLLGLMPMLARGEMPAELAEAEDLAERMVGEVAQMREEHRLLSEALRVLAVQAEAQRMPQYVALAEDLIRHNHVEEEVLYPAAALVGLYAAHVRAATA